jgi:predicted ATPase
LLSGEAGIGKSRLVQELKNHVAQDNAVQTEFRCSPYHQNSALYPIIDHLQRFLRFEREDSPAEKLKKLDSALRRKDVGYGLSENSQAQVIASAAKQSLPETEIASSPPAPRNDTTRSQEMVPLLAALLSLPHPVGYPPLTLSPQKQKEKTYEALVAWLIAETKHHTVCTIWEDLHWADPSTLEVLNLVMDQAPTTKLYMLLTFRPEFIAPWGNRSHLSQLTLSRLGRGHVEAMVERVTGSTTLPQEIVQQIVSKTDGVPLFVEELTKSVVETTRGQSTGNGEQAEEIVGAQHAMPTFKLGIPTTLHAALMARLDRLGPAKEIAQLGATIGREFSYDLLHAVSLVRDETLQHGLKRLVEAELVYQRGLIPHATYLFKHALIQDTAYQSLLKSTRQQYHQQIVQKLEEQFPETKETQPELLAYHYTEAGLIAQALPYWQRAGERAVQRSAYVEAVAHFTKGLELLQTLPDTSERTHQELGLQLALAAPLIATKGYTAPEVERVYARRSELCRQLGETSQLFWALQGLWVLHLQRAEYQKARKVAEQGLSLAQNVYNPIFIMRAHLWLGDTLFWLGEFVLARDHLEKGIALYDPQQHRSDGAVEDPGVTCLCYASRVLWSLGYADQALQRSHGALTLARELSRPYSLAYALDAASLLHQLCREVQAAQERAEAEIALSTEHGFPHWLALGTIWRGWALADRGWVKESITQMRQGIAAWQAMGAELGQPYFLGLLATAYGKVRQVEEGLTALADALARVEKTGERWYEAELYRLKGELTLAQSSVQSLGSSVPKEAETSFLKAVDIARKQQAKSLELRAVISLVRLRQHQAQNQETRITQHDSRTALDEAHKMLSEVYSWFTEGFDTKDLQEAKALLDELT